jgi:acyl-CoA thioesterase FadM
LVGRREGIDMHCHEFPARFRDFTVGQLFDHTRLFDLVNDGIETLTGEIGYELRDIVASDGVPYAPVDSRGVITHYPAYQGTRTIHVHATPIAVTDRSFVIEYEFRAGGSDESFCRIQQTHVTIDPNGGATSVPEGLRGGLERFQADRPQLEPGRVPDLPGSPVSGREDFSRVVQFRSPHIEAAGLGFMGDYFRFIASAFESYLESRGISLADTSQSPPFIIQPESFQFEFRSPIRFEDRVQILGRVTDVATSQVTVQYDLDAADSGERKISGTTRYSCFDATGELTALPAVERATLEPT